MHCFAAFEQAQMCAQHPGWQPLCLPATGTRSCCRTLPYLPCQRRTPKAIGARNGANRVINWVFASCLFGLPLAANCHTYEEKAVAAVLMGEAWSEGIQGMTAVAEVIHQRSLDKKKTPLQVVMARGGRVHAFSCLNGTTMGALITRYSRKADYDKALEIAQAVCEEPDKLPGLTQAANHFTLATEQPYWAYGKQPVVIIGQHAFYKLKSY
jgi:spore germination cell wall hydrolase CwlJ-like protein